MSHLNSQLIDKASLKKNNNNNIKLNKKETHVI